MNVPLFKMVSQPVQLHSAVREISSVAAIGMDTESNSRHRYPEQLCLIQITSGHQVFIVDTLALCDLTALKAVLADKAILKVMHGADYDIRCLDRHYGFHMQNLYDTSVAARFCGITEFGLAALIKNLLGVEIVKNVSLQQSNWGQRPLSIEALEYAAGDVHHLLALREILEQRLQVLGRTDWVAEECVRLQHLRYAAPDIQTAFLSIKGSQFLDGRGLAILRSLCLFRETESRRQSRPPFFVIPDFALISLANYPDSDLSKVPGTGPFGLQRFGPGLRQSLRDGQAAPPIQLPPRIDERPGRLQLTRLTRLKSWRAAISARLALDPSLLWPTVSLGRLAGAPDSWETEIRSADIRGWQREQFADSLKRLLEG